MRRRFSTIAATAGIIVITPIIASCGSSTDKQPGALSGDPISVSRRTITDESGAKVSTVKGQSTGIQSMRFVFTTSAYGDKVYTQNVAKDIYTYQQDGSWVARTVVVEFYENAGATGTIKQSVTAVCWRPV